MPDTFIAPTIVLHIPHASTDIPAGLRRAFVIDDAQLKLELLQMTDHYTDELFLLPPDVAASVAYPVSRLVCDPERFPADSEEPMAARGMGVIYTARHNLESLRESPSPHEREELLTEYYWPHHRTLEDAVSASLDAHGQCLVIDCHSFPSEALPYEEDPSVEKPWCRRYATERPDICIGTDEYHTTDALRDAAVSAIESAGYSVAVNYPFAGALVPASRYQEDHRVAAVMIEVNRKLYMNEQTGARAPDFLVTKALLKHVITTDLSKIDN